ncbi:MAG: hypothetical protein IKK29_03860 [Christensenellaceae bacterium]|nr:hypothetical protein [Christensenellaceae bacterium]
MKRAVLFTLAILMIFSVCSCKKTQTDADITILASSESCVYIIGSSNKEDLLYSVLNSVNNHPFSDLSIEDFSYDENLFTEPGIHEITFSDKDGNMCTYPVCSVRKEWLQENAAHLHSSDPSNTPSNPVESFGISKFIFTEAPGISGSHDNTA